MPEKTKNVWQRINDIIGDVTAVEKSANVDNKYKAVTHDDVTRKIRGLTNKHGVVVTANHKETEVVDTGMKYGARNPRSLLQLRSKFDVSFVNVDNPDDTVVVEQIAWADDSGDKGPGKVQSYAEKYASLKMFKIPTGENDEERVDPELIKLPPITTDQHTTLVDLTVEMFGEDSGAAISRLCKLWKIKSLDELPAEHYDRAVGQFEHWNELRGKGD